MSEGLTQEESWVPIEVWERVKKNMSKYKVGDVISFHDFTSYGHKTLPAGTVLVEVGTWKIRTLADEERNGGYVFTDRLGWYGVEEFHVVHIPEPVEEVNEVDELATELMRMYLITGNGNLDNSPFATSWRAMARYVLDNYTKNEEIA